jgi:hypothetical protein
VQVGRFGSGSSWFRTGKTPRVVLEGLFEDKAVGGRHVKACRRCVTIDLEELEIPRGTRRGVGVNPLVDVVVLTVGSKALESRAGSLAPSFSTGTAGGPEDTTGGHPRPGKPGTARRCGRIPEGRTLDVAVGRNRPTRPKVEQTVEGGRNAKDGTKPWSWDLRACVDSFG